VLRRKVPPDESNAPHPGHPPPAGAALCPLGTIVNTHGIHGELRLLPYNPDSTTLGPGAEVTLRWPDRSLRVRLHGVRPHKRFRLLLIEGYDSASDAESLIGAELCVPRSALPPLAPGEVYHFQVIGLRARTIDGRALGTVREVLSTGGNDVCVARDEEHEYLIPLVAEVVRAIDVEGGELVIDPLPGLLDL
jgi:16S rRNA processing protein RimM